MVKLFRARGAKGIIGIKPGAKRCRLPSESESVKAPACRVEKVAGRTGAGDALLSGVITGFEHGIELTGGSAECANIAGVWWVQTVGSSTGARS